MTPPSDLSAGTLWGSLPSRQEAGALRPAFPQPSTLDIRPYALAALAAQLAHAPSAGGRDVGVPSWPPRGSGEVFADIAAARRVLAIEVWTLLADTEWWARVRTARDPLVADATTAARVLWRRAHSDSGLASDLRWGAAMVLGNLGSSTPKEVARTWESAPPGDLRILGLIANDTGIPLALDAMFAGSSPRRYLLDRGFPGVLGIADDAAVAGIQTFLAAPWPTRERWVIACLEDLPLARRDACVDEIVRSLSDDDAIQFAALRARILAWYADEGISRLSSWAQTRLRRWDGMASWDDIERFVERIFNRRVSDLDRMIGAPATDDAFVQARWALGRVAIWSNYSAQFRRVRIFVPQRQLKLFRRPDGSLPENVSPAEGAEPPSAIFAVGGYIVVQYLYDDVARANRGGGARRPTLFYKRAPPDGSAPNATDHPSGIGLDQLAPGYLSRLSVTARVECWGELWQRRLYETIERLNIPRNAGLARFRGFLPKHLNANGLPR